MQEQRKKEQYKKTGIKIVNNKIPQVFNVTIKKKYTLLIRKQKIDNRKYSAPSPIQQNHQTSHKKNHNKNPIKLIKHLLKNQNQMNQQMNNLDIKYNNYKKITESTIKPQELITLSRIKPTRRSGPVFKKIHVPTFQIYAIKQQPIVRQSTTQIKQWNMLEQMNDKFVSIYNTFWNSPQGCLTLVLNFCSGLSLQVCDINKQLMQNIGALPQFSIKQTTVQVLQAIQILNEMKIRKVQITPKKILFNLNGDVKIAPSIGSFDEDQFSSLSNGYRQGLNLYNQPQEELIWKNNYFQQNQTLEQKKASFKVGLLVLLQSIGSFQFLEHPLQLFQNCRRLLNNKQMIDKKQCCLIHSEVYLHNIFNCQRKINISILDVLQIKKLSGNMVSFLCKSLKLSIEKRGTICELLNHNLLNKNSEMDKLMLKDLLKISQPWSTQDQIPGPYRKASELQLNRICHKMNFVLSQMKKQQIEEVSKRLNEGSGIVQQLGFELGLQKKWIVKKLLQLLNSNTF